MQVDPRLKETYNLVDVVECLYDSKHPTNKSFDLEIAFTSSQHRNK